MAKQATSRPTTNDSQYTVLQLKEIETAQLYSTPTQRNDDIERVALAQTTKSFSPKPLNMAANIDSIATQGVNSHSPIPTNPTYSHALEGTTSLFAGFHFIPIVGDYEAKQQQKQQKQQQQQQQNKYRQHRQCDEEAEWERRKAGRILLYASMYSSTGLLLVSNSNSIRHQQVVVLLWLLVATTVVTVVLVVLILILMAAAGGTT